MKIMTMTTHADDPKIPRGKATLILDGSGWVGTNNGCPFHGQPALFPEAQAAAIRLAWNSCSITQLNREMIVPTDIQEWLS